MKNIYDISHTPLNQTKSHAKEQQEFFENGNSEKQVWMTTTEAAKYLRVSKWSLLNFVSSGRVPYYKLGRSNRYRREDLDNLLLSQRKGGSYGNQI